MERILVVEDEARIADFVSRVVGSKGFSVECLSSGVGASDRVRSEHYALVLLDLVLPGLDGETVLKRILAARPQQRVIILSAVKDVGRKVRCLELGAVDYVCKPFSVEELLARIETALRDRPFTPSGRFLRSGNLTLDLARRRADNGAGEVRLTEREFVLLSHLMASEGDVVTREELLSRVWGLPPDTSSNVVDVYIRRIRGKLGLDVIETVRNVGYSLTAG